MGLQFRKLPICVGDVTLKVAKGHFATRHSHINYLIDVTAQKASLLEAAAVAQQLAERYLSAVPIDTILCLDGTRVIGTCLAGQLTQPGSGSVNEGRDMYLLMAGVDETGHVIMGGSTHSMVEGKHVLVLMSSVTTGETARISMEGIHSHGGYVSGIASIYSSLPEVAGVPVSTLYDCSDLPDYASFTFDACPLCQKGVPLDALIDSFGYSEL